MAEIEFKASCRAIRRQSNSHLQPLKLHSKKRTSSLNAGNVTSLRISSRGSPQKTSLRRAHSRDVSRIPPRRIGSTESFRLKTTVSGAAPCPVKTYIQSFFFFGLELSRQGGVRNIQKTALGPRKINSPKRSSHPFGRLNREPSVPVAGIPRMKRAVEFIRKLSKPSRDQR